MVGRSRHKSSSFPATVNELPAPFDLTLPAARPQPGALKSCKTMSTLSPAIVTHVGQRAPIRVTIA
jgi:hypothetical protein